MPKLINVTEAAKEMGLGRTKLYELIAAGEIQVVRIGRAVRIPTGCIDDWIRQKLTESSHAGA